MACEVLAMIGVMAFVVEILVCVFFLEMMGWGIMPGRRSRLKQQRREG